MRRGTLKTSTIFIAKGDRTHVYHSENEIPRPLREELEESVSGMNSTTILIIDRRAREEIRRALESLPAVLRTRLALSLGPLSQPPARSAPVNTSTDMAPLAPEPHWLRRHVWKLAAGSAGAAGLLTWLAMRFWL